MNEGHLRCMDCIYCVNIGADNFGHCTMHNNQVWCYSLTCKKFIGRNEIF